MTTETVNISEQTLLAVDVLHAHLIVKQLARPESLGLEEIDTLFSKSLMHFLLERVSRAFYAVRKQTEDEELAQMGFLQLYPRLGCGLTHSLHAGYVDLALRYQNVNLYRQHRRNGGQSIRQSQSPGDDLPETSQYRMSHATPTCRSLLSGAGAGLLHQFFHFDYLEGIAFRLWFDRMNPAEIVSQLNSFELMVEQGGVETPLPTQTLPDVERLLNSARKRIDRAIEAALPLGDDLTRHQRTCQQVRRQTLQLQNSGLTLEECSLRLEAQRLRGVSISNLSRKRSDALVSLAARWRREQLPDGAAWDEEREEKLMDWLDRFFKSLQRRAAAGDSRRSPQLLQQAELELQHDAGFNWTTRREMLLADAGLAPRERWIIRSLDAESLPPLILQALQLSRDTQATALAEVADPRSRFQELKLTEAEETLLSLLALHNRYATLAETVRRNAAKRSEPPNFSEQPGGF